MAEEISATLVPERSIEAQRFLFVVAESGAEWTEIHQLLER
jgi:hypothetical protein